MPQQEEHDQASFEEVADELESLGISTEEAHALKRQGFVAHSVSSGREIYKLRFRLCGRQQVRYLGTDGELAERVRRLLAVLQRDRKVKKQLRDLNREAAEQLRELKQRLKPFVTSAGLKFHGLAVRRPRRVRNETSRKIVRPEN